MTAAAPKRQGASPNDELARALGSTKGVDPIPPDQYLYFLGKSEPPLQRLLALVRSKTIRFQYQEEPPADLARFKHRAPYCVDDKGKALRPADLERLLEMEHGNFKRTFKEAIGRGLIRVEKDRRAQALRVFLCGSIAESVGYTVGEEKGGVCTDPSRYLSPGQRKTVAGWPKERQERFYADFAPAVKYKSQLEAEAIAMARHIGNGALDQVFAAHDLPKLRLATAPPEPKLLQLTLSLGLESVQTRSVQAEPAPTRNVESVPTGASLYGSENPQRTNTVSQSVENRPTDAPGADPIRTLLLTEYGARFPGHVPTDFLCRKIADELGGAPLEFLRAAIRRRMKAATTLGFAQSLAHEVGVHWKADTAERERRAAAERDHAERNRRETILIAQETLADPRAGEDEKELAREILKSRAAAGGV